jgi:uncharacterized protein (TIRG00374 family)
MVVALVLLAATVRSADLGEVLGRVARVGWAPLAALALCNAVRVAAEAARWRTLIPGGRPVRLLPLCGARLAGFAINYVTPGVQVGGEVARVAVLERGQGVSRDDATAGVAADKAADLASSAVATAVVLATSSARLPVFEVSGPITAVVAVLTVGGVAGALASRATRLPARVSGALLRARGFVGRVLASSASLPWRRPRLLASIAVATLMAWFAVWAELLLVASALDVPVTPATAAAAATLLRVVSQLVPVPAGVAAHEAAHVVVLGAFALDPTAAVSVAVVLHLRDVALAALGFAWLAGQAGARSDAPAAQRFAEPVGGRGTSTRAGAGAGTRPPCATPRGADATLS